MTATMHVRAWFIRRCGWSRTGARTPSANEWFSGIEVCDMTTTARLNTGPALTRVCLRVVLLDGYRTCCMNDVVFDEMLLRVCKFARRSEHPSTNTPTVYIRRVEYKGALQRDAQMETLRARAHVSGWGTSRAANPVKLVATSLLYQRESTPVRDWFPTQIRR